MSARLPEAPRSCQRLPRSRSSERFPEVSARLLVPEMLRVPQKFPKAPRGFSLPEGPQKLALADIRRDRPKLISDIG